MQPYALTVGVSYTIQLRASVPSVGGVVGGFAKASVSVYVGHGGVKV